MKKVNAVLLIFVMALTFAACGGKEDKMTPESEEKVASSVQQEQKDEAPEADDEPEETSDEGEEQVATETFEWPTADYITADMKYDGSGTIVYVDQDDVSLKEGEEYIDYPATWVYFSGASVEDAITYVSELKAGGFSYLPFYPGNAAEDEPVMELDEDGEFQWVGVIADTCYVDVNFDSGESSIYEEVNGEYGEIFYNLKIFITTGTMESGRIMN